MSCSLRIGLLVEERYLSQLQPAGLLSALRLQKHQVTLIVPETIDCELGNREWFANLDLIVARGRGWRVLALLAQAETHGKMTINTHRAITAVHNKAELAGLLRAANVPTPHTYLGDGQQLAKQIPNTDYPLIVKPIFGDNGRGLRLLCNSAELAALPCSKQLVFAQSYLPNDGYDIKLYGVGDTFWATRKPSPFNPSGAKITPSLEKMSVTPAMEELGRRCRQLFGLDFLGIDCVQTAKGLSVIEVNDFPNYTGVPEVDRHLVRYIEQRAYEVQR